MCWFIVSTPTFTPTSHHVCIIPPTRTPICTPHVHDLCNPLTLYQLHHLLFPFMQPHLITTINRIPLSCKDDSFLRMQKHIEVSIRQLGTLSEPVHFQGGDRRCTVSLYMRFPTTLVSEADYITFHESDTVLGLLHTLVTTCWINLHAFLLLITT